MDLCHDVAAICEEDVTRSLVNHLKATLQDMTLGAVTITSHFEKEDIITVWVIENPNNPNLVVTLRFKNKPPSTEHNTSSSSIVSECQLSTNDQNSEIVCGIPWSINRQSATSVKIPTSLETMLHEQPIFVPVTHVDEKIQQGQGFVVKWDPMTDPQVSSTADTQDSQSWVHHNMLTSSTSDQDVASVEPSSNSSTSASNDVANRRRSQRVKMDCFTEDTFSEEFPHSKTLKEHERLQTGEKPFECNHCGKKFTAFARLQHHRSVHKGTKSYSCSYCGMKFSMLSSLRLHARVHTAAYFYKCSHCKKKFRALCYLKLHERVHNEVKPFQCASCGTPFSYLSCLRKHALRHTGEKLFQCSYCKEKFSREESLIKHQQCLHAGSGKLSGALNAKKINHFKAN